MLSLDSTEFIEYITIRAVEKANLPENKEHRVAKIHKDYRDPTLATNLAIGITNDQFIRFKKSEFFRKLIKVVAENLKKNVNEVDFIINFLTYLTLFFNGKITRNKQSPIWLSTTW